MNKYRTINITNAFKKIYNNVLFIDIYLAIYAMAKWQKQPVVARNLRRTGGFLWFRRNSRLIRVAHKFTDGFRTEIEHDRA